MKKIKILTFFIVFICFFVTFSNNLCTKSSYSYFLVLKGLASKVSMLAIPAPGVIID